MNKIILIIVTVIFGLFFLAFGVGGTVLEFKNAALAHAPVHTTHLGFFIFFILLGSVLMPGVGTIIFGKIKDGVGLAGDAYQKYGRRASQGEIAVAPPADTKGPQ